MQEVLKNIPTFKGRLNYMSDMIKATADNLPDDIHEAQQFEIIESCIECLSLCSVETKRIVNTNYKAIIEALNVKQNKILAIKEFRSHFEEASLREAKEEVERVYNGNRIIVDRWEYNGELLWVRK